jgi:hypothetical protein
MFDAPTAPFTKYRSWKPSLSMSIQATPEPNVSIMYLSGVAPD